MEKLYVEELKNGKFKFRLRYFDPITGKMKRVSVIKDRNTKQVYNQALRELQDKILEVRSEDITVEAARELYIKDKARIVKLQTVQKNNLLIRNMNKVIGEDVLLNQLTAQMLKSALLECTSTNCAYNEKLTRYKVFLKWCYENEYISDSWYNRMQLLPDNKRERIEDKYLEKEELHTLLDAMALPQWYYVTYFLALSGLRIGELIALKDSDIDEKYIHVNKTYSLQIHEVGTTKTYASTRDVFIQDELRTLIRKFRLFMKEYKFERGIQNDLFICGPNGEFMNYDSYRQYLHDYSLKSVGRKITPHALRHTCASILIAEGVPLDVVSRRLGHDGSEITKRIYIHVTKELQKKDEAILKKISFG